MIDVNMLPRELTGYVGHVCGLWFGSYFIDFEPVFVHSTAGIIGELYEYLVDTVQDNSMNGGLDYEDAEEYAKLAATVPWSMEEIDRVAEQSFRYVSDRTLQVAYALCVLTFDAMFPQKIRRIHCGERSARSPVTLACRTGTSWPQAGGTVRRCSTITTCPVAG